eukprot:s1849_g8.t1
MQVLKLQSKWVLQIILRIFTQNQPYEANLAALQAFLPRSMDYLEIAVLSPTLASALKVLQTLAHASDPACATRVPQLAPVLESASATLTSKILLNYHRTFSRVTSTTHFKKLLNEGHQLVVNAKLDQEADEKGKIAAALAEKVSNHDGSMQFEEGDNLDFTKVMADIVELQKLGGSLPAESASRHSALRASCMRTAFCSTQRLEQYLVKGLASTLANIKLLDSGEMADDIPGALLQIFEFVKGKETNAPPAAGKILPGAEAVKLVNFLPFSQRSFLVYIGDFAAAIKFKCTIKEESLVHPFNNEIAFLALVDAVRDSHRCPSNEIISAGKTIMLLCSNKHGQSQKSTVNVTL